MTRTEYIKLLTQIAATLISSDEFGCMIADDPDNAKRAVRGAANIIEASVEFAKSVKGLQEDRCLEETPF
jgi:hypothetical protein